MKTSYNPVSELFSKVLPKLFVDECISISVEGRSGTSSQVVALANRTYIITSDLLHRLVLGQTKQIYGCVFWCTMLVLLKNWSEEVGKGMH